MLDSLMCKRIYTRSETTSPHDRPYYANWAQKIPIGGWHTDPKQEMNKIHTLNAVESIPALTTAFYTRVLGYTLEETQAAVESAQREILLPDLHLYAKVHIIYGQKKDS